MLEALDQVLGRWSGEYRFVTVPKLLQLGAPQRVEWNRQGDVAWLNAFTALLASRGDIRCAAGHGQQD